MNHELTAAAEQAAYDRGRRDERAEIAQWLHEKADALSYDDNDCGIAVQNLASDLERGPVGGTESNRSQSAIEAELKRWRDLRYKRHGFYYESNGESFLKTNE